MGVFSFTEKLVSEIMSSLGLSMMMPQYAPIDAIASGGKCVAFSLLCTCYIEGVFLPRNSIPRIGIRSRQKWERISSTPFQCLYCAVYVLSCCCGHVGLDEAFA